MTVLLKMTSSANEIYSWAVAHPLPSFYERRTTMNNIITCEQVSKGHVDKICDQIADAIVTDCLSHDPESRVAIECLFKGNDLFIAGEITSDHTPDYAMLVKEVFEGIHPGLSELKIKVLVSQQSPDIAQGVDTGGAGDQGVMYGYATNETPELLPIPFVVATHFIENLEELDIPVLLSDAKAQVSFDYDTHKITTFLCSVQHREDSDVKDFRPLIESLMILTAAEYGLNTDFEKLINPTGRFVVGGSAADTGVTGRKLACDTYGGVGHIGGGALSGKDPTKVDRSGAYMARKIAVDLVSDKLCDRCEVQLAYAIGKAEPISVSVETFGTEKVSMDVIGKAVGKYDLTPDGIIKALSLKSIDYNDVSYGGHFGKFWLPWEVSLF